MLRLGAVVGTLPEGIATLEAEADAEAVGNVSRLIADWTSGAERFSRPGELLLVAYEDECLVGVGGITVEPDPGLDAMRLRRFYVRERDRGRGIGRALALALIETGLKYAPILTVNAGVPGTGAFWEALGFRPFAGSNYTHQLRRMD